MPRRLRQLAPTRIQVTLDARGWTDLSRACLRLLERVSRIEDAGKKGIARNPHTGDTEQVALVMPSRPLCFLLDGNGDPDRVQRRVRPRCALRGCVPVNAV